MIENKNPSLSKVTIPENDFDENSDDELKEINQNFADIDLKDEDSFLPIQQGVISKTHSPHKRSIDELEERSSSKRRKESVSDSSRGSTGAVLSPFIFHKKV